MDTNTIVVGIDAHKDTCTYAARTWQGLIEEPATIPSTREDLEDLAHQYPDATFVIEACSVHEWMHDELTEHGVDVRVVHPPKRESVDRKKNDGEDAKRLAKKHLVGDLVEIYVAPPKLRKLRDQLRYREFLKSKRTAFKNRIQHELNRWGYRIPRDEQTGQRPNTFTQAGRGAVLEAFPHLDAAFQAVDLLTEQMDEIERELATHARKRKDAGYLLTIPGVGTLTSMALLVEMGDVDRFEKAKHVVSYFGLDPVKGSSGDRAWDEHRMSKKGTDYVRGLLDQAAKSHLQNAPGSSLSIAYRRWVAKGKPKGKARGGVMRKLVRVAFRLLKEERGFKLKGPAPASQC